MSLFDRLTRLLKRTPAPSSPTSAPGTTPSPKNEDFFPSPSVETSPADSPVSIVSQERRHQDRQPMAEGLRIMVVDDSPTIMTMLSRMLTQNGIEVSEAVDAETGMEIAHNTLPHLIFLDIVLPGMNGFEALRRLRRDPLTKDIPVIMISGNELATEQFYAQRIGADDFMKKPFSRHEVFNRIEKLLGPDRLPQRPIAPNSKPLSSASSNSAN